MGLGNVLWGIIKLKNRILALKVAQRHSAKTTSLWHMQIQRSLQKKNHGSTQIQKSKDPPREDKENCSYRRNHKIIKRCQQCEGHKCKTINKARLCCHKKQIKFYICKIPETFGGILSMLFLKGWSSNTAGMAFILYAANQVRSLTLHMVPSSLPLRLLQCQQ